MNMKETVKLNMACVSSINDRIPVPQTFTPLHYTSLYFTTLVDALLLPI